MVNSENMLNVQELNVSNLLQYIHVKKKKRNSILTILIKMHLKFLINILLSSLFMLKVHVFEYYGLLGPSWGIIYTWKLLCSGGQNWSKMVIKVKLGLFCSMFSVVRKIMASVYFGCYVYHTSLHWTMSYILPQSFCEKWSYIFFSLHGCRFYR